MIGGKRRHLPSGLMPNEKKLTTDEIITVFDNLIILCSYIEEDTDFSVSTKNNKVAEIERITQKLSIILDDSADS